jgi:hypothetical protein
VEVEMVEVVRSAAGEEGGEFVAREEEGTDLTAREEEGTGSHRTSSSSRRPTPCACTTMPP